MKISTSQNNVDQIIESITNCATVEELVTKMLDHRDVLPKHEFFKQDGGSDSLKFLSFDAKFEFKDIDIKVAYTNADFVATVVVIITDISYLSTISQLRANDNYKGVVLASVSHELRTPLNGCMAMLQTVMDDKRIPVGLTEMFLKPATNSLKMLLMLVNDILDYSQINANKFRMVFQKVNLEQLILEACGIVELQAKKKEIDLNFEFDNRIDTPISTDPNRLTQIILNLLSNAIKFTIQGAITISCNLVARNPRRVKITVSDTGIGMKPEDVAKLFQNYTKIDLGEKASLNPTGCGLGLGIANRLAMSLGRGDEDHMQVTSKEGEGSAFTFFIEDKDEVAQLAGQNETQRQVSIMGSEKRMLHSIREGDETERDPMSRSQISSCDAYAQETDKSVYLTIGSVSHKCEFMRSVIEKNHPTDRTKMNETKENEERVNELETVPTGCRCPEILIADDDAMNIYSLQVLLKAIGSEADSAYNGAQGIHKIENRLKNRCSEGCKPYKLVFLDYEMPIKGGLETAEYLDEKIKEGSFPMMKLIGCTGHEDEESKEKGYKAGMNKIITKPINRTILKDLVTATLLEFENEHS